MKNNPALNSLFVVLGLVAAVAGAYVSGRLLPNVHPAQAAPVFSTTYSDATPVPFPASKPQMSASFPGRIHSFALSPDGKTLAFATSKGAVFYDLGSGRKLQTLNEAENVFSLAWSPDGRRLALGSLVMRDSEVGQARLVVWDTATWKKSFEPKLEQSYTAYFGALAWSPFGNLLAVSDHDRGLLIFDVATGRVIAQKRDFLLSPFNVAWSPSGSRMVATGDLGFGLRRWRLDTNESVRLYDRRAAAFAVQMAWSRNGQRIASVHQDGTVCIWTVATNRCDGFIKAHLTQAFSLAWSPDETQLATGGGAIRIWDTQTGEPITSLGLNALSVYTQLDWLPDGRLISLEAGYLDPQATIVRFWDLATGKIEREFQGGRGRFD